MTIGVIAVSSRAGASSLKVANNLAGRLEGPVDSFVVDLHRLALPLFGHQVSDQVAKDLEETRQKLQKASGFVVVVPEWNGAAAPGWANLMLYVGGDLAHKPVMLVGVSSGRGGAYPLLGLRSAGYKNSRYVVIPESLIVGQCGDVFADDGSLTDNPAAASLGPRADYALAVLKAYAEALESVWSGSVINHEQYPSGI